MQCQSCKEHTATIHLTEINNGQRFETHLCELCAQKQGLAIKNQIPLNELLSTLLAVQAESEDDSELDAVSADTACPACGITLKQFTKKNVLGCPHDYEVFEKQLRPIIRRAHNGNTTHCGKVPSRASASTKNNIELIKLQRQLDAAVQEENYEAAAKLRDKIKRLQ
jgi:protein arginine kinase activator